MYPIGSLVPPKKPDKSYLTGTILQGLWKLTIWNRDTHILKNGVSLLPKGVQSSITTLKCSEDSHCGVRIRVSKSSDIPFPRYGPRHFFGPVIFAKNSKIYIISNLFKVRCRFLCLLVPEIDCNCLFNEITKGNDILEEK